jgi:hypothetical protein
MAKIKQKGWTSRNNIIKVLRAKDEHGWLHLYVAQRIDNQKLRHYDSRVFRQR